MNKVGLSQVVTTLLFVLLALGAVLLVWTLVKSQITAGGTQIEFTSACLNLELEPVTCTYDSGTNTAAVTLKRGNKDPGMTLSSIKLIFELFDGTGVAPDASSTSIPGILETKADSVSGTDAGFAPANVPTKFTVAGVLTNDAGVDHTCTESSIKVNC